MMRRHLLLLIALCLHMAARGQTIASLTDIDLTGLPQPTTAKQLRYWFDEDGSSVKVVGQLSGQQTLDVASLTEGLHTLHFQIIDNTNAVTISSSSLFLKVGSMAAPTTAQQLRYWFDDNVGSVRIVNGTNGTYAIDALSLTEGLHTLHFQIIDSRNELTVASSTVFMRVAEKDTATAARQLRYWFDDDAQTVRTVASNNGVHSIDANALVEGLHTVHCQVVGGDNTVYSVVSGLFLKTKEHGESADVTARKLMYWFDDEASIKTADMTDGMQLLDASELVDGLHTVHYQVLCSNGQMTSAVSSVFLRVNFDQEVTTAQSLRYWFDNEQTATEAALASGVQMVDASKLEEGLHTIHYQVVDNTGALGSTVSSVFLKMSGQAAATLPASLRYWYDDGQTVTEASFTAGTQTLDASGLVDGLHTIHYQVVDNTGAVSATASSLFMKQGSQAEAATAKSIRYWFDDDAASANVVEVNKGSQIIDVTGLLSGLHTLHYQLVDADGQAGIPVAAIFMKGFDKTVADGENRITQYQYWLNDNSQAMQTVRLDKAVNPYQLIALLPMQKEPIRSQQFRFEITDGQPTIYAENTFNVRFHDAADYFVDADKAFVDYSVKQTLTDIELLESGVRAVTAKPTGNDIKWYKLDAEPGDSLQFRLDRAATVQLFAPSGEEVLNTSGSEVVNWFGKHVTETGTYYLALHNTTATYGNTVSIDYNHIDKYAVLRQDVSVVGNGGCSTITFEGNGFCNLKNVSFFNQNNNIISSSEIEYISDSEVAVICDFGEELLGKYNALFDFGDEKRFVNNSITIEEADSVRLSLKIENDSRFLLSGSATFTIKITNTGNSTAYRVPLEIQLYTQSRNSINYAKFSDNIPEPSIDWLDSTIVDKDSITALKSFIAQQGDLLHFVTAYDSVGNRFYKESYLAIDIAPKSTYVITLTLKSNEEIELQAIIPSKWMFCSYSDENKPSLARARFAPVKENMCCVREKVECVMNVLVGFLDLVSLVGGPQLKIADCIASLSNTTLQYAYDVWCGESLNGKNMRKAAEDIVWDAVNGIVGCICSVTGIDKFNIQWIYQHIYNNVKITWDCVEALAQEVPNCPPNPDSDGGKSTPVSSFDPNEMYGYTAESTSHAVKDGLTDVYYRIQFENDTTFATAAAHDIYLSDTLDVTKFDLSTFRPTRVKIGEKSAELSGDKNFVTTIDMRPEINAIAQVEGTYDEKKGIARWHISSLDPMTMEPTEYVMDGVLPVNTNGHGIGEVSYDISLKPGLAHGTTIGNRAGIVFDSNDVIMTPTWTNVIDRIAPESHVTDVQMLNDSTASVSIDASDELFGTWRYDVYVQYGSGAWFKAAENVPVDTTASVKVYEGINHGFYVVVTDSAGNVEQKAAEREYTFEVFGSQIETDTQMALAKGWNWISHNQQEALNLDALKPKATHIVGQTEELFKDTRFGWMGDLEELLPTQMYKLQMDDAAQVQLSGRLFNAGFRSIPLYEGWNWMGYPVANTMTPAEALSKLEAEEGDMLIGQDGLSTYSEGQWQGTLLEMNPGQGYMYRSASDKNLFLNATAQASSRRMNAKSKIQNSELIEGWTVDKRKYPNVMGVIAQLWNGNSLEDAAEWQLGAFCGEECRGIGQEVNGMLMMNVYGNGGEQIAFRVLNLQTGEVLSVSNLEDFRPEVLGTMTQPYELHIGDPTGVKAMVMPLQTTSVYDLMGRRLHPSTPLGKGVYVVTDGENRTTQKVIRR